MGPKLRIHELQPEDHDHQEQEILEGEHVPEGHARVPRARRGVGRLALVIHQENDHERDQIEAGRHDEGAPQAHELGDHAADNRSDRRAEALRGLHESDRLGTCWRRESAAIASARPP